VSASRSIILVALFSMVSCSKETPDTNPGAHRLYLWLHGADELVPEHINPGKGGGSAIRLGEALKACGSKEFAMEFYGLTGEAVLLPSTSNDAILVGCVRRHVDFGFNASRATPAEWQKGGRSHPVAPAGGS
jgi:hypothetical protein